MSLLATAAAVGVSLGALGHLAATDPKRRRSFRLPPAGSRRAGLAWAAALLPGLLVPVWSGAAGFFAWLGAVTVAGWWLAATAPGRGEALLRRVEARVGVAALRARNGFAAIAGQFRARRGRVAAMAARISELEAEVEALRQRLPAEAPRVVELARAQPMRSEA